MSSDQIGNGKASGLIEFLDLLVEKGRATNGSIAPLKSATRQVLTTVDGDEKWTNTDIKNLDVTDYINRFKNKSIGKYDISSYVTYQSRVTKAKDWYCNFLANPGWTPPQQNEKAKSKVNKEIKNEKQDEKNSNNKNISSLITTQENKNENATNNKPGLISYPFVLLDGTIVSVYLPAFLKSVDAKRLGRFIESLSIDSDIVKQTQNES